MKKAWLLATIILHAGALALFSAGAADAACYADYKAKRDNPLRLHYGVMKLPDAICAARRDPVPAVERRLEKHRWTLLTVLSVFGEEGLQDRKESAGEFFLRF